MSVSEVGQLRRQIELELGAMRRGLSGFALGTARHDFIQRRMKHIGVCQDLLAQQLGERAATTMVCQLYIQAMEQE